MIHTYVQKKTGLYRYYVCVKAHQRGWAQCETRCVSAPALENAVLEQLRGIGAQPDDAAQGSATDRRAPAARTLRRHRTEKADVERELRGSRRR